MRFGKMKKKYFLVRLLLTLFSSLLIFLFILPYLLLLFKVINIGNILGLCIGFFILFIGLFLPRIINIVPPKVNLDKFIKANKVVKMTGVVIDFSSIPVA